MTSYVENETEYSFPFEIQELLDRIMEAVMDRENCPYETTVNLLLTDNAGIREYNREYRSLDRETDVLSFPNIAFVREGDFSVVEADRRIILIRTAVNWCWAISFFPWSVWSRRHRSTDIRFSARRRF